jgi:hypothetical protein
MYCGVCYGALSTAVIVTDGAAPVYGATDTLEQGSPNYGPRAKSGRRCDLIRPAKELCRNAPTELIFQ